MQELPDYNQALSTAFSVVSALQPEEVKVERAAGRVLRDAVTADRDQPPFDRSAMDGFALRADAWSAGKVFRVVGSVPAGGALPTDLEIDPQRDVVRIATGAAVPAFAGGFDAVVPIEKAAVEEDEHASVVFEVDAVTAGMNIHRQGADAATGSVVIASDTLLQPHHLGIAASVGATTLKVSRPPRVVVLSSGDEVRPANTPTADLEPQQIRNSNGPMLVALLKAMGCEVIRHEHVLDEADAVHEACSRAATEADLVVTAGGVSVGQRDWFPATWPQLGYETVLHGVKMQPGKPVLVARPPRFSATDFTANPAVAPAYSAAVVGLPGNPVSVLATAHLFVWPMVRKMLGLDALLPWRRVGLASPAKPNARREAFRAARFVGETREQVEVLPWQGSGDLSHTAAADGWVRLPVGDAELTPGVWLSFLPLLGGYADPSAARRV
ncbi:MAG: molybdopterin molybdotransferase MoeA [Planctomycetota bacterium]